MGGEDWQMWIDALDEAGVLADGAKTTAYTYIGEKLTWDIYWHGTIGAAKKDLDKRVISIRSAWPAKGGDARVSVLKAVVTQASAAIPAMPIYLALLFKVMKERGVHEGCIEQIDGLFRDSLYSAMPQLDEEGRLRADRKELDPAYRPRWRNCGSASTLTRCASSPISTATSASSCNCSASRWMAWIMTPTSIPTSPSHSWSRPMLEHGIPFRLNSRVRRLVAPNPGVMTGPGTNTYLLGDDEVAVLDPGPAIPAHIDAILETAGRASAGSSAPIPTRITPPPGRKWPGDRRGGDRRLAGGRHVSGQQLHACAGIAAR